MPELLWGLVLFLGPVGLTWMYLRERRRLQAAHAGSHGLPSEDQQREVLDRLYGAPDSPEMAVAGDPLDDPDQRRRWATINHFRARMELPQLSFREWYAGAPLEAETIYPESAAELKQMPTNRIIRPRETKDAWR